jgi:hypothetical protein
MSPPDEPRWIAELWPEPPERPPVNGTRPAGSASAYAAAAFQAELDVLGATQQGKRNDQLNIAAFSLSQLVAAGHLGWEETEAALVDMGLAVGLTPHEVVKTVASGMRAGATQPRQVPERPDQATPVSTIDPPGPQVELELEPELVWSELWEDDGDDDEWVVEPILPARRLVALYSPPKIGKSLLLLELAVAISRGTKVLGYQPDRPRHVLYVDLENDPRGDVRTRLQQMGLKPEDLGQLHYLSFPTMPYLDTPMGGAWLLHNAQGRDCEVVVVDTIGRVVGGEENDNDTWLRVYRNTGQVMKAAELTMIRLDHTGKDLTKGMRGGSAKYGDVDLVWSLSKINEEQLQLDCTAQRIPVPQRTLLLRRVADPWLHHEIEATGFQAAALAVEVELALFLDQLVGEDTELGVNEASKLLRQHGRGKRKETVSKVVSHRDLRFNNRGLWGGSQ